MAERLAKVLEKLAEEGKLQSTLTALESTSSTQKEPQPSSQRKFSAAILVFFFLGVVQHTLRSPGAPLGWQLCTYWEYS